MREQAASKIQPGDQIRYVGLVYTVHAISEGGAHETVFTLKPRPHGTWLQVRAEAVDPVKKR